MAKRVFLDTDIGCEIDDQFALAYAARHPNLRLEAIGCAFFTGEGFVARPDSVDLAYDEALRVRDALGREDVPVYRGLRGPLNDASSHEDASRAIVELAHAGADPLYVISIGAQTNFAHALRLDPSIASKVHAVFIDGDYPWGPGCYNVPNDIAAFQAVLDSDVQYLHVPAPNVTDALTVGLDHLRGLFTEEDLAGRYLIELSERSFRQYAVDKWTIWDVAAIAAVAEPALTETTIDGAPLFEHDPNGKWLQRVSPRPDNARRIGVVSGIDAGGIWNDIRAVMAR